MNVDKNQWIKYDSVMKSYTVLCFRVAMFQSNTKLLRDILIFFSVSKVVNGSEPSVQLDVYHDSEFTSNELYGPSFREY